MTFNSALFNPIQLCLEIDPAVQAQAWQQSQSLGTSQSRWDAYLNQLCLQTLLPWFREDDPQAAPAIALSSVWELVSGTAIHLNRDRLLLLPTEAIDTDELRVPQEWVDIPGWAADYYLAVQVNPDDGWLRVTGFTTHQHLKTQGRYDWRDRTYSLEESDWVADLSALSVAQQLSSAESARAPLAAIAPLPQAQAQNLLDRLVAEPECRLALPFPTWAGLIQDDRWRQQLADRRRGLPAQRSVVQWLQAGAAAIGSQLGWERVALQPSLAGARGTESGGTVVGVARRVAIAGQPHELRILPVAEPEQRIWRFELVSLTPGGQIPPGVALRLLTADLQPFAGNEDRADAAVDRLYIEVALEPGEGLVWEIDPTPADYDREILRF